MCGEIDVRDVSKWLEKVNLGGETLYEEGVTTEVSTGVGGTVILAGKSQREDHMVAQIIKECILRPKQIFY